MVILDNCPDLETSEFYARRAAHEGWTRPALQTMIASRLHERTQPALTTFDTSVPDADRESLRQLAVTEWRRLPPEVRRALPTAEDLTEMVTRTVREIESTA